MIEHNYTRKHSFSLFNDMEMPRYIMDCTVGASCLQNWGLVCRHLRAVRYAMNLIEMKRKVKLERHGVPDGTQNCEKKFVVYKYDEPKAHIPWWYNCVQSIKLN